MNLHQIVRGSISSVNPETYVKIKKFKSFTIDETGKVKNEYSTYLPELIIPTFAQIQPVRSEDLEHIANYNSANIYKKMFINGTENGLSQALNTNGDLVVIEGIIWKIVEVVGLWNKSGWNTVIICNTGKKDG